MGAKQRWHLPLRWLGSISGRAFLVFGAILIVLQLLGFGFFIYQRSLFDPEHYNQTLIKRLATGVVLLDTARPPERRLIASGWSTSSMVMALGRLEEQKHHHDKPDQGRKGRKMRAFSRQIHTAIKNIDHQPRRGLSRRNRFRNNNQNSPPHNQGPNGPPPRLTYDQREVQIKFVDYNDLEKIRVVNRFGRGDTLAERLEDYQPHNPMAAIHRNAVLVTMRLGPRGRVTFVLFPAFSNSVAGLVLISLFALLSLAVVIFGIYTLARITGPIRRLAKAADSFGQTLTSKPLQGGPSHGEIASAFSAFNTMQDRVVRLVNERTRMIGAMSHDLRTLLTRLRLRAEMLPDDASTKILKDKSISDIEEMEAILETSLEYSRHSVQEGVNGHHQRLDLSRLLQETVQARDQQAERLNVSKSLNDPVMIMGDRVALKRLWSNLLDNGLKYAQTVALSLNNSVIREGQAGVEVIIEDDGPGIPLHERSQVLEAFYRLESSRNRATGGTGLGLTIASDIVRHHGGHLSLDDRADGTSGLRVSVWLPTAKIESP